MEHENTIYFSSAGEAEDVLAPRGGLLRALEEAFSLRTTARDNWLKLGAEDEADLTRVGEFIALLRYARGQGADLRGPTRYYLLRHFLAGDAEALREMVSTRIEVMNGKRAVFAKTLGQGEYLRAIQTHDVTLGLGPAGTGKTYLAMAMAVSALLNGDVNRIILTRPAVEAGEALGFLPGDLQQKILPYLRPLYDALHDMMDAPVIAQFIERGVIEVAPLAYMRGRTLNNSFILLDEAQNTTEEQMLMFLTRIGYESKCVVNGDPSQVDLPNKKRSGLREAMRALHKIEGISMVNLTEDDVVRHALVQRIIRAYRNLRDEANPQTESL
ncbi:MAG: PhoH family protein [Verrucomicrobia bacterium]|nr:PhoH family protein [Verrucomicrobiota bacterium]MCH8511348.1 PhoH family protein [Kiritimatiellia bacterium]